MTNDYLYYWEELGSNGKRQLLGQVQCGDNGFNMSFVIDGTKDSTKLQVLSFDIEEVVKPYTVVYHENTNTWWIVTNDKVEKVINDDGDFLYIHNLQLEGAIELLNARDLTDCGFYQNTYNLGQCVSRLFQLSNFELESITTNSYGNVDLSKKVDFVKTFENYTLLSALRELFDAYNCSVKAIFVQGVSPDYSLINLTLNFYSKAGNINTTPKDMDTTFNDIKEIKTLNKNSYGTSVVSNAENVISTKYKIYPSIGFTRISGDSFYIKPENACIRLPSKVNSVEYVDLLKGKIKITIGVNKTDDYGAYFQGRILGQTSFDTTDVESYNRAIDWLKATLLNDGPAAIYIQNNISDEFWESLKGQYTLDNFNRHVSLRLYDITEYDPINNIYLSEHTINKFSRAPSADKPFVLGNKNLRGGSQEPKCVVYWERGSNLIKGFDFFDYFGVSGVITSSSQAGDILLQFTQTTALGTFNYKIIFGEYEEDADAKGYIIAAHTQYSLLDTYFRVKYVPMSDIKIKYDNHGYSKNVQLYNQNGKLTDGFALSKLLLSYKDEIESDNITRYKVAYSMNDMPKAGDIITKNNKKYVINNVSLDFYQNETNSNMGYFIVGEFTMSKSVSTKSLLTNPNTNIRDYGIPQSYNVRRKQLYRDFYELDFTVDDKADSNYYLTFSQVFNLTNYAQEYIGHTAIMRLTFDSAYGGGGGTYDGGTAPASDTWYYQLDSTLYYMKKALYEIVDFQDNNIIGYDCQNVSCGFDIRRLLDVIVVGTANIDTIATPISYVDNSGKVNGIEINMCNPQQLMDIYQTYADLVQIQTGRVYSGVLYNRCVFISPRIYEYSAQSENHDFSINELNYNKDPIEVPVFEYSCQIDDTDNVLIGDDILETNDNDSRYLYEAIIVPSGVCDNNTWITYFTPKNITSNNHTLTLDNSGTSSSKSATIDYMGGPEPRLFISLFDTVSVKDNVEQSRSWTGEVNAHGLLTSNTGKVDLMIVRYTINKNYTTTNGVVDNVEKELVMVIKDAKNCPYSGKALYLIVNHYKLN